MTKHHILIAIAALLGSAAQAQTATVPPSITLYGLVDVNLTHYSAGEKSGALSRNSVTDGTVNGLNGSRWGLKVSQDVAHGLKVGALLEGGFTTNDGKLGQGGRGFGRQAFASIGSADLGELRIGRQYVLSDAVMAQSNPFGNALTLNPGTGVTVSGKDLPMWLNAPRADNVIQLQSPSLGGLVLAGQVAPETPGSVDRFQGVRLAWAGGPVNVAVSSEWNTSRSSGDRVNKSLTFGANVNLGGVKVLGGVQRNRDLVTTSGNGAFTGTNLALVGDVSFTVDRIDGTTLGVEIPAGDFLIGANVTRVKYGSAAGDSQTLGKVAAGVRYALSDKAFLYASLSQATGDLADYASQNRAVQVGTRFAF